MSDQEKQRTDDAAQRLCVNTRVKINAWLRVLPRRDHQKLHQLESLFLSVATGDRLLFDASPSACAELNLTSNRPDLIPHNSVRQAWDAFVNAVESVRDSRTLSISTYLEKRIPEKTGLGAGSGDAGATLLALNQLHGLPFGHDQLAVIAQSLGSDVPFFVESGPCIVRGAGEIVNPIPPLPPLWCCIALPTFSVDTGRAYSALDDAIDHGGTSEVEPTVDLNLVMESLRTCRQLRASERVRLNSFEATLGENTASFLTIRRALLAGGAILAGLSGSGSALFGIYAERAAAEAAALDVRRRISVARALVAEIV